MTEEIITDYRQTVQRLQEELKEKSDMIFKLMDYVARLEQENNSLQAQVNNVTVQSNNVITALEQENKELKEKVKSRENELANMTEQANMRINTYRSALEEIREIAKDIIENDVYENSDVKAEKILDKINEVLDES